MAFLREFREFAFKGNVIDLAIAFIIGAAFGTVVKSFVDDVIMPPVGWLLGDTDFRIMYWVIDAGTAPIMGNTTLADARASGAIVIAYGQFINNVIALLIVALALFLLVRNVRRFEERRNQAKAAKPAPAAPTTKECPYCYQQIPLKAVRCGHCTSTLAAQSTT